jgi:hypothetical protein
MATLGAWSTRDATHRDAVVTRVPVSRRSVMNVQISSD